MLRRRYSSRFADLHTPATADMHSALIAFVVSAYLTGGARSQPLSSFDRLPPSYAPSCTIVNSDGTYSPGKLSQTQEVRRQFLTSDAMPREQIRVLALMATIRSGNRAALNRFEGHTIAAAAAVPVRAMAAARTCTQARARAMFGNRASPSPGKICPSRVGSRQRRRLWTE